MRWMLECRDDARFAIRQLTKAPAFAAIAALTIALGIGATTAIFSVVHAVVLQPLPYPDPDQLMVVGEDFDGRGRPSDVSIGNFSDWRTHAKSFSALGASNFFNFNLSDEGRPERVLGARVTHTWFSAMATPAEHGRVFARGGRCPGKRPRRGTQPSTLDPALRRRSVRRRTHDPAQCGALYRHRRHARALRRDERCRGTVGAYRIHAGAAGESRRALSFRHRPTRARCVTGAGRGRDARDPRADEEAVSGRLANQPGRSRAAAQAIRRRLPPAIARVARRRHPGTADRVRQRRQPPARAWRHPREGDGGARRHWCEPRRESCASSSPKRWS